MQIQCTKKLLNELKVEPESVAEENPLFSWHANIMTMNRRKTVVLMNDCNRYAVVLYGLKAKDFKRFNEIAEQAIRTTFEEEGIREDVIDQYFLQSAGVTFTKTKDRTSVARMNKACETAYFFVDLLDSDSLFQPIMGNQISRSLVGNGKNEYILPNEKLYDDLNELVGQPIFESKVAILKVALQLEDRQVWRRLVVPLHKTFHQFHRILQVVFEWQDYHLHDFTIYDSSNDAEDHANGRRAKGVGKPIINLVCDQEAFSYPGKVAMKHEKGVKLSEYLLAYEKLVYVYDFGDDWHHDIEVESIIEDYEFNYPICLEAEGNAPPEDVGGAYGYEEFLNVLANPNDPEYEHMVEWGKMQGYRDFHLEDINFRLKRL